MSKTYTVSSNTDDGMGNKKGTLSYGLSSMNNYTYITFSVSEVTLSGQITVSVTNDVTVYGGSGVTIIAGSYLTNSYLINDNISPTSTPIPTVTFQNITFNGTPTNTSVAVDGGINVNNGNYKLENCTIKDCKGGNGSNGGAGGVNTNNGGAVTLTNCTISGCKGGNGGIGGAGGYGGAGGVNIIISGIYIIINCTISGCTGGSGNTPGTGAADGIFLDNPRNSNILTIGNTIVSNNGTTIIRINTTSTTITTTNNTITTITTFATANRAIC